MKITRSSWRMPVLDWENKLGERSVSCPGRGEKKERKENIQGANAAREIFGVGRRDWNEMQSNVLLSSVCLRYSTASRSRRESKRKRVGSLMASQTA